MWYIILFFATLFADQITKIICDAYQVNIPIIDGVLRFDIAYNKGASFSFLSNAEWGQTFFKILTIVVLAVGVVFLIVKKPKHKWLNSALALMFSGTIGNFIDRLVFSYVRDFINVPFFANFNVADICLCVGAFMLIFYVLFLDSDPVFKFPSKKKQESEVNNDSNG
jgi:signal peptidase II